MTRFCCWGEGMAEIEIKPDTEKIYQRLSGSSEWPILGEKGAVPSGRRATEPGWAKRDVLVAYRLGVGKTSLLVKPLEDFTGSAAFLSFSEGLFRESSGMTRLREQAKEAEIQQLKDQLELIRTQRKRDIASAITSERNAEILHKVYSKTVVPLEDLRVSVDADDLVSAIAALSRADLIYVRDKSIFITSQGIRIVEKYLLS